MARQRLLSPGFFTDEKIVGLSFPARLLFQGLWCEADRLGRLEDKPGALKMRLFPADPVDVNALLAELLQADLVRRYTVEGRPYLVVVNFLRHQHPNVREQASKLPPPPVTEAQVPPPASHLASTVQTPSPNGANTVQTPAPHGASTPVAVAVAVTGAVVAPPTAAARPGKARKAKLEAAAPGPPDPRHAPLVVAMGEAFLEAKGHTWVFDGREAKAVTALLALGAPEEVLRRWRRALRHVGYPKVSAPSELAPAKAWNAFGADAGPPRGPAEPSDWSAQPAGEVSL